MSEGKESKFVDEVKELIMVALAGNKTGGGDIDVLLRLEDGFVIIEFLRCVTIRPYESHPNRYWSYNNMHKRGNKYKFLTLWGIAQKTKSKLILINYEDKREQFKIIEVKGMSDAKQIYDETITKMGPGDFEKWFKGLVAKSK